MKYLCLDYGEKRTGVAVSDAGGNMAFARDAIFKKTRQAFFDDILGLLEKEESSALVLGLPVNADGSEGPVARQVRNLAASLKRRLDLPIYLIDEAFSSAEAEIMLKESGQKYYKRDGRVDSLAAARVLDSFLRLAPEDRRLA